MLPSYTQCLKRSGVWLTHSHNGFVTTSSPLLPLSGLQGVGAYVRCDRARGRAHRGHVVCTLYIVTSYPSPIYSIVYSSIFTLCTIAHLNINMLNALLFSAFVWKKPLKHPNFPSWFHWMCHLCYYIYQAANELHQTTLWSANAFVLWLVGKAN